jgi:hypothetical protein
VSAAKAGNLDGNDQRKEIGQKAAVTGTRRDEALAALREEVHALGVRRR